MLHQAAGKSTAKHLSRCHGRTHEPLLPSPVPIKRLVLGSMADAGTIAIVVGADALVRADIVTGFGAADVVAKLNALIVTTALSTVRIVTVASRPRFFMETSSLLRRVDTRLGERSARRHRGRASIVLVNPDEPPVHLEFEFFGLPKAESRPA